jgi:hypothetical protein
VISGNFDLFPAFLLAALPKRPRWKAAWRRDTQVLLLCSGLGFSFQTPRPQKLLKLYSSASGPQEIVTIRTPQRLDPSPCPSPCPSPSSNQIQRNRAQCFCLFQSKKIPRREYLGIEFQLRSRYFSRIRRSRGSNSVSVLNPILIRHQCPVRAKTDSGGRNETLHLPRQL